MRINSILVLGVGKIKVKPAPFCVLDEIDAAMDESNVDRFGRFLQNYYLVPTQSGTCPN